MANVQDFVSVEEKNDWTSDKAGIYNVTVWDADGAGIVVYTTNDRDRANIMVAAIQEALRSWPGWHSDRVNLSGD